MQYDFFIALIVLILAVVFYKYIISRTRKHKSLKNRTPVKLKYIYAQLSSKNISYLEFEDIWLELSREVDIPPEKLRLDDTMVNLAKYFSFPEVIEDILEDYLLKYKVESDQLSIYSTIEDIVNQVFNSKLKAR